MVISGLAVVDAVDVVVVVVVVVIEGFSLVLTILLLVFVLLPNAESDVLIFSSGSWTVLFVFDSKLLTLLEADLSSSSVLFLFPSPLSLSVSVLFAAPRLFVVVFTEGEVGLLFVALEVSKLSFTVSVALVSPLVKLSIKVPFPAVDFI